LIYYLQNLTIKTKNVMIICEKTQMIPFLLRLCLIL